MYKAFYGLNDNPFSIAPNPHYMFLSERHCEALAHLTYGLGETGGFVLLTGEVGTGKTTVSRCLMKQLPEHTDTAFILNPSLTELELLAALCDELEIAYGDNPSLKKLTDLISMYLLNNHKNGRNTVLIIDEAQHLRSEVLEQLRLLTNLETDTKKLLQVILIGQPELQQLLKRQDLRQLAQRITARYHLLALSENEIGLYVSHRLQVAGRHEPLFTRKAIKALHKHSGGIPRLTNLLCERALMAGYGQAKVPIDHKMINQAAIEVLGEIERPDNKGWPVIIAIALILTFVVSLFLFMNIYGDPTKAVAIQPSPSANNVAAVDINNTQVTSQTGSVESFTKPLAASSSAQPSINAVAKPLSAQQMVLRNATQQSQQIDNAFAGLFGLWNTQPIAGLTACQAAQQQQLNCLQLQGDWQTIMQLNYPAVVYLQDAELTQFFGVIVERQGEQILLQLNEQQFWVNKDWFTRHFSGMYEILWQPNKNIPKEITINSSIAQIQWLENSLASIGGREARLINQFDAELTQHVMAFQNQRGLDPDGIAGYQTLIQVDLFLNQNGPRLTASVGQE